MSNTDAYIAELMESAATLQDQTKVSTGGERVLPPAGETIGRLVSYIEVGPQMFSFQGKETGVAPAVYIGFELLHPVRNMKDGKGQFLTLPLTKLSVHSKARFLKLFNAMRYGREDKKHMAQMLSEPFKLTIEHSVCGKYANIVNVQKPYMMDIESGDERLITVPPATKPLQLFLWNNPTKESWDSLFIDGEYTKDDGTTVSKNRLQNMIKAGPHYSGSLTEMMLTAPDIMFDDVPF